MDASGDKIGGKIRNAELAKVHTMLIIGQKEQTADQVAVRIHGKGDQGAQPRAAVIAQITADIKSRKL
jgi:threonyl-tRNA synthetase